MEKEQIIFLLLALAFSILGMFMKSRKRKVNIPTEEDSSYDFLQDGDINNPFEPAAIFEQNEVIKTQQKANFHTKTGKKKPQTQNIAITSSSSKNPQKNIQNVDLENSTAFLEDFEGTEIQKAFLYSEIFKNTKS